MSKNAINQILNLFWTILFFAPVVWYWYRTGLNLYWYLFLLMSALPVLLPYKHIEALTFFDSPKPYEKLGVKTIRWFAQDGTWASGFKTDKGETTARIRSARQAQQYLATIAMYERFHWMCLIFFFLSSVHAFAQSEITLGILITLANVPFNWGSVILQQYNKLRIRAFLARSQ